MKIKQNKVEVKRTGVYFQAGDLDTADVNWFVCHGYGQLGDRLIKKFNEFVDIGHSVISVEAMNRFYWSGVSGHPVSTWMTSRFRLDEINDNNAYLSQIYGLTEKAKKRVLCGFSQGGTTMWRWIFENRPDFDVFINYAGWMPEDIDLFELKEYLSDKKLIFTYGSEDEYLTPDRIEVFQQVMKQSTLDIEIYKSKGKHKVNRTVLNHLYQLYIK